MGIKVGGLEPAYLGDGEAYYSPGGGFLGLGDQRQGVSKLDDLTPRERRVLEARVLADKPMTLEDLAAGFGVARERVRQLEARVREKMGADYQTKPQIKNHITKDQVVRAVEQEARALFNRDWLPKKETLAEFAALGTRLGFMISAHGHGDGEWLYDMAWSEEIKRSGGGRYTTRLPLVLESEEKTDKVLDGDFIKLVQARADVRVWIVKVNPLQSVEQHIAECKEEIRHFAETKPDDVYVLMIYNKAGKPADFKCFEASTVMKS